MPPATRGDAPAPTTPPGSADVAAASTRDPFLTGPRGPYVWCGAASEAEAALVALARSYGAVWGRRSARLLAADPEPVRRARAALRDHLVLVQRTLAKAYEGRIVGIRATNPASGLSARLPPTTLDVELETQDDRRSLHLEQGYVRAFLRSGARIGDIVQIAQHAPLVTLRPDRDKSEGRVAEERDLTTRIRLGDQDHIWPEDVDLSSDTVSHAAPAGPAPTILGSGTTRLPSDAAQSATDRWVEARLAERRTYLEPGFLLITHADHLPHPAHSQIAEALRDGMAPIVLLHVATPDGIDALRTIHGDIVDWPR